MAFAAHGTAVPIREIARRAGVSTGTVSRHFPTKEALFRAVVLHRIEHLVRGAEDIAAQQHPGTAFFTFFALLVRQGAADHAVGDALGAGFDLQAAASTAIRDLEAAMIRSAHPGRLRTRPNGRTGGRPCVPPARLEPATAWWLEWPDPDTPQ